MEATVFRPFFQNILKPDHLIAPFKDNRGQAVWIGGVDGGWESPCAVVLGRGDGSGRLHVSFADEFRHLDYSGTGDVIDYYTGGECDCLGVDPAMRAHHQQTGKSDLQAWRDLGFDPCVYPMAVRERLVLVRRWLAVGALQGGITIEHGAEKLYDALAIYTIVFEKTAPSKCITPAASHLVDAFSYLLLRYAHMLSDGTWEPGGLPPRHPAT